ncbi:N-acetyltransferase [Candidatus Roizmanbacteria bacterium]|nr:N-acetyltransferase [Candidatus Roizmanbacteria bacterium]
MKFNGNFKIGNNVNLGKNVKIGDETIVYDNAVIGDNTIIANNCIIGEPINGYYSKSIYKNPKTLIGANTLIRSHSIIYAGSSFGDFFQTGHRVIIREQTVMGQYCHVGTFSDIQGFSEFGHHCRLHSNVHIGQKSKIGNFVFIYPYVVFTNDPTPPSNICIGPTVDDYAVIATGAILMPGVHIGKHALIGAGCIVTKNVDNFSLVLGSPAKHFCDVRDVKSRENNNQGHYPWPYHFDRGMPWEKIGYKKWLTKQNLHE